MTNCYTTESKLQLVEEFITRKANGDNFTLKAFASEHGICIKSMQNWLEGKNLATVYPKTNTRNSNEPFVCLGSTKKGLSTGLVVEYHGASIKCADRTALMNILSCLRELG